MKNSVVRSRRRLPARNAAALLIALGMALGPCQAKTSNLSGSIDHAAQAALQGGALALQVVVFKEGQAPLVKAYGTENLEQNAPATGATVFRVASVTKQFTAAAILRLAEQGKLSIDDSLAKTFPDFPRAGEVKIRHLLSHTSGLHNYTDEKSGLHDCKWNGSVSERVAAIAGMPQLYDFSPGTQWSYSNSGYFLLGAIVEKVSGQPFGKFLEQQFFAPLGMSHTALDDSSDVVLNRASGYEVEGTGAARRVKNAPWSPIAVHGGAGALRSTAEDLAKWGAALLGGKVLKPESLRLMTTPVRLNDGRLASSDPQSMLGKMRQASIAAGMGDIEVGMGLNLQALAGHEKIGHGGGIPGFVASLNTYPAERVTVVVLSNTTGDVAVAKNYAQLVTSIERIALGLPEPATDQH